MLHSRILDIEYEMTQFAFYYVGIAAAVFLLGYFQVGLFLFFTLRCSSKISVVMTIIIHLLSG